MLNERPRKALVSLVALASAACVAQAAGLGVGSHGAVLGQSLDYTVAVRLEPGETLTPECVSAEVSIGDRWLVAANVRVLVEAAGADAARVRVLTNQVVDEPVVAVQLSVGCGSRVSRRYVVLADPVGLAQGAGNAPAAGATSATSAAAVVPAYAAAPPDAGSLAQAVAFAPLPSPAAASGAMVRALLRTQQVAANGSFADEHSVRRVALRAAATSRAQRRAEARAEAHRPRRRPAAVAAATTPRRVAVATPAPRLKLDFSPPLAAAGAAGTAVDEAMQAVAQAAAAARQQAAAASAAAERIAALERTVENLRGEARSSRDLSLQLREQMARTESAASWAWPLAAAAVVLATLATWLGLRLAAVRRQQHTGWQAAALRGQRTRQPEEVDSGIEGDGDHGGQDALASRAFGGADGKRASRLDASQQPARTAPVPFVSSVLNNAQGPVSRFNASPAWPPPSDSGWMPDRPLASQPAPAAAPRSAPQAEAQRLRVVSVAPAAPAPAFSQATARPADSVSPTQATVAFSQLNGHAGHSSRDVSIEELLDLEQQAEFFVVLGQDEAAIDLLVEHLRHTGGGSPLPYLKLLEIYRRRGDRGDYERTRARFNHRFNAYAPEWEFDLQAGRVLADYPDVLPRLQAVWARPLDSMAELEALLFRKSRGEMFDLPAYREVLFLYALARDLLDRESASTGMVDLLLPLSHDTAAFEKTAVFDPADLAGESMLGRADFEDRPTAPIDLDLSFDNDRPASIFDPLEEQPRPLRRR